MSSPVTPASRQRSIRSAIIWLLVLPLVTLAGLWAYAAVGTIGPAVAKQDSAAVNADIGEPDALMTQALEIEQASTFIWQATRHHVPGIDLRKNYAATDAAVTTFQAGLAKAQGSLSPAARQASVPFLASLATRTRLRAAVQAGSFNGLKTFEGYLAIQKEGFAFSFSLANPNASIKENQQSTALIAAGIGTFDIAAANTLLGGVIYGGGYMTPAEYQLFAQLYYDQVSQFNTVNDPLLWQVSPDPYYPSVLGPGVMSSPQVRAVIALEKKVLATGSNRATVRLAITPAEVQGKFGAALAPNGPLVMAQTTGRQSITANDNHQGTVALWRLGIVGGAGLLVVILSAVLLLRFGNRITRELTGLRGAARALSGERLPSVVRRLRAGEDVDVAAEAPPLDLRTRTREVTDTAEAFSVVQRTAVEAAVEQAQLRKGVSNVFRSLARRNQSLVQRQLRMLDEMERGTQDPDALAQLFRLDHLTTRMRRQAEGLIILSGAAPGRRWRQPVPVVEVLRGAISEIEDYVRVDLVTDSPDYVTGTAVADVTHLLAELIENAVVYSPPATRVQVRGGRVANGYVVEVEDRGLGIPVPVRETLNERLKQPPEFDLADSDQLGLFVVSRLAVRHGIRVSLRESGLGGTTAVVLLPVSLIVSEAEAATLAAQGTRGAIGAGSQPADEAGEPASAWSGRRAPRLDRPVAPFTDPQPSLAPDDGQGHTAGQPFGGREPFGGAAAGTSQPFTASQPFGGGQPMSGREPAGSGGSVFSRDASAPSRGGSVFSRDEGAPSRGGSVFSRDEGAPSRGGSVFSRDESAPSRDESAPSRGGSVFSRDESAPSRGRSVFSRDASVPSRDESAPSRGGSVFSRDESAPSRDGSVFSRDESAPRSGWNAFDGGQSSPGEATESLPARPSRGSFGNPAPFQDAPAASGERPAARRASPPPVSDAPAQKRSSGQFQAEAAGDGGGQSSGTMSSGLPQRQRMASMSPQLRDSRPEAPGSPLGERSPEQARALLSSIQRGLRTGREAGAGPGDDPGAGDGTGTADSSQG
jgi:signal transduction histidine kinase